MLALATGWTPDVLADMPADFRAACHWAMYARAIVGPEGLPSTDVPRDAPIALKREAARLSVHVANLRTLLYPEGDD